MKYIDRFLEHFSKKPVFTTKEVGWFLEYSGSRGGYQKRFMQNILRSKRAFRISKGVYTTHRDSEVIGFAFSPFYYGLAYALSYHNVWEERANPVIITTNTIRTGVRKSLDINVSLFTIPKRLFFGYQFVKGNIVYYPISDLEKTFIDTVYFNIALRRDVMERLVHRLDKSKLKDYLSRCPTAIQQRSKELYREFKE